jgi:hypothetical protein
MATSPMVPGPCCQRAGSMLTCGHLQKRAGVGGEGVFTCRGGPPNTHRVSSSMCLSTAKRWGVSRSGVQHWLLYQLQWHGTMGLMLNASRCVCASPVLFYHRSDAGLHCPLFFLTH